jgi:hypothetical protein
MDWKPQPGHETTVWFAFIDDKPVAVTRFYYGSQKWLTQVKGSKIGICYASLEEAKERVEHYLAKGA